MTIEKLLENNADFLESLSNEELHKQLTPFLQITRPELAPKPEKKQTQVDSKKLESMNPKDMTKRQKQLLIDKLIQQRGLNL